MIKLSFNTANFKSDLKAFEDKVTQSLDSTTKEVAEAIKTDARYLDSDLPSIANGIDVVSGENGYTVVKGGSLPDERLAAYHEFGTGDFASALLSSYPEDWKAMARQYYVNGKGRLPARPSLKTAFDRNTVNIAEKVAEKIDK